MAFDARISCKSCAFRHDTGAGTLGVTPLAESFERSAHTHQGHTMSHAFAAPAAPRTPRASHQRIARATLTMAATLGLLVTTARAATAQSSAEPARKWNVLFSSGAFIPAGDQRDVLKDAQASAVQLSWLVRPALAVTGSFGWARSRDRLLVNTPKLDVFTSDVGLEYRAPQLFAGHVVTFSPFAGLGAGARSYNYRKLDVDATHNLAGYGAIGGELGIGRVGLRVEARDYVAGFKPLNGTGASATRNDVSIMAGLTFHRHGTAQR